MSDNALDLSVRARRGEVSPDERRQLETLLEGSAAARLLHQAGCDLDAESGVLPGDHEIADRVTRDVLRRLHRPQRQARARVMLTVAAALLVGLGGGVAFRSTTQQRSAVVAPAPAVVAAPPVKVPAPASNVSSESMAASVVTAPAAPTPATPRPPQRRRRAAPIVEVVDSDSDSAEVLAVPDRDRTKDELGRSLLFSGELQRRYPTGSLVRYRDDPDSGGSDPLLFSSFPHSARARAVRLQRETLPP